MEEDKNKRNKRNKKKKNKHNVNQTEGTALNAKKSASDTQNHVLERGEDNNNSQVSRATDELTDVGGPVDANKSENLANCSEEKNLSEADKLHLLGKEASFLEKLKELQAEKDAQIEKQAFLEEKIKQLLKEKDENSKEKDSQKDQIQQLQDEKYVSMKNEAGLKEKLLQLEEEKDALIMKKASLETQIIQLQADKDSWAQKEAVYEAKINQMMKEAANLNLKENSTKELNAHLTNDNAQLRAQVLELEQVRESLLEEKQELKEIISSLKLQITSLERDASLFHSSMESRATPEEDMKYQIDAAEALVEKLMAENSQLVEKVTELHAELDRRGTTEHHSSASSAQGSVSVLSTNGSNLMLSSAAEDDDRQRIADSMSDASKMAPISGSSQSLEEVMAADERNGEHVYMNDGHGVLKGTSEIIEDGEIVQIPLVDENEVEEINSDAAQNDEDTDVSLADAPLIGAPFRLISYVARYVSGADLVNKNAGRS